MSSNKLVSSEYETGAYKLFRYNLSRERIGGEAEKSDIDLLSICHLHIHLHPLSSIVGKPIVKLHL